MDRGHYFDGLDFFGGTARGMSPSSVMVTSGMRSFGFERVFVLSDGRPVGESRLLGERGSVLLSMVPPLPAIHSRVPPRYATACRNRPVTLGCICHFFPPSSVMSTVPNSPTAIAFSVPSALTANKLFPMADSISFQFAP